MSSFCVIPIVFFLIFGNECVDSSQCINNLLKDSSECIEKYRRSMNLIRDLPEDGTGDKLRHRCCAFEWRRKCLVRKATELCGNDTIDYLTERMNVGAGPLLSEDCASVVGSCDGSLYGAAAGSWASDDCSLAKLRSLGETKFQLLEGIFSSPLASESDFLRECKILSDAFSCAKLFPPQSAGNEAVLRKLKYGNIEFVEEICNPASETRRKFLVSFGCIKKLKDPSECTEKAQRSFDVIRDLPEDGTVDRVGHGCCAYEWRRKCLVRKASESCGHDKCALVDDIIAMEGGELIRKSCASIVGSCDGSLYGVVDASVYGVGDASLCGDVTTGNYVAAGGRLQPSFVALVLMISIPWINRFNRD